jgi:integral membrane sensor domain MASE1
MGAESGEAKHSAILGAALYALELSLVAAAYFAFAQTAQLIPSINPIGTPVWPPAGVALALFLLRGYRVWPAIFIGSFLAGVMAARSWLEADLVAIATLLGALAGSWLLEHWSNGHKTFATPLGVTKFALIAVVPTALASATLTAAGF